MRTCRTAAGAALLPALLVAVLGGCYRYSTADRGSLSAGDEVVLTLAGSDSAPPDVGSGPGAARTVEGRLVSIGDSAVAIRTSRPAADPFRSGASVVDTVRVAARRVESIRSKELETAKTAAVAGGVALGVGVAGVLLLESVQGDGTLPGNGGDDIDRGLIRFP